MKEIKKIQIEKEKEKMNKQEKSTTSLRSDKKTVKFKTVDQGDGGQLLDGEYDEAASRRSFQEAL